VGRALVEADEPGLIIDAVNVPAKVEVRQNMAAVLFYLSSNPDSQSTSTRSAASHGRARWPAGLVRRRQRPLVEQPTGKRAVVVSLELATRARGLPQ
jgi:hypothetical protein